MNSPYLYMISLARAKPHQAIISSLITMNHMGKALHMCRDIHNATNNIYILYIRVYRHHIYTDFVHAHNCTILDSSRSALCTSIIPTVITMTKCTILATKFQG
jgi:hypothetical protein